MLQSLRMLQLLKSTEFRHLILWMLVDEAHLVDETSGTFLQVYQNIIFSHAVVTGTATVAQIHHRNPMSLLAEEACTLDFRGCISLLNFKYVVLSGVVSRSSSLNPGDTVSCNGGRGSLSVPMS